jgi:hypothetical protein
MVAGMRYFNIWHYLPNIQTPWLDFQEYVVDQQALK